MNRHEDVRPLLAARPGELSGLQALQVAEHVEACQACAAESATYQRLMRGLAALASVEVEPPAGLLDRLLVAVGRRRPGALLVAAAAAGSAGIVVAGVVVVRTIHHRRVSAKRALTKPAIIGALPTPAQVVPVAAADARGALGQLAGRLRRLRPA